MKIFWKKILLIIKRGPIYVFRWGLTFVKSRIKYYQTHEVRKSYGNDMPDKTFYIIGINEGWCGLFAILTHQLTHIAYALDRGYIPIIDLQNFENQYLGVEGLFKKNAWECFFQQPMGYDLNSVKKAKNVIKSVVRNNPPDFKYRLGYMHIFCPDVLSYYKGIYEKHIKPSHQSLLFLSTRHDDLFKNKGKVLGVHCRGTDYTALRPCGHPIQPDPGEVIKKAEEVMREHHCDHVYLATEDADINKLFAMHFGEKLILDYSQKWCASDLPKEQCNSITLLGLENSDKIQRGLEYLSQIYLLSQCACFIGGNTCGSLGALLMPNKFEYSFVFDLGKYK